MGANSKADAASLEPLWSDLVSHDMTQAFTPSLARSMDGTILQWSNGMERLSGYSSEAALGRVSHELLQVWYPVPRAEMEAALQRYGEWTGGIVYRHRDATPVAVSARWLLRHDSIFHDVAVHETHVNVIGTAAGDVPLSVLAELLMGLTHELSQPLTAMDSSMRGVARLLAMGWPDRSRASQALRHAITQSERAKQTLRLIRTLNHTLHAAASLDDEAGAELQRHRNKAA